MKLLPFLFSAAGEGDQLVQRSEIGVAKQAQAAEQGFRSCFERIAQRRGDRRPRRQSEFQRVALCSIDEEFIVQMRTAGQPGLPDVTDDFTLTHPGARMNAPGNA